MERFLVHISMIQKMFLYFRVIFVIGDKDLTLLIIKKKMDRYGEVFKD